MLNEVNRFCKLALWIKHDIKWIALKGHVSTLVLFLILTDMELSFICSIFIFTTKSQLEFDIWVELNLQLVVYVLDHEITLFHVSLSRPP